MLYLILAICASAAMALTLKLFRAQRGNRYGLLLGNYLTCVSLAILMLPRKGQILSGSPVTLLCGLGAGVLFVAALVCMQSSTRQNGATLTSAFARLGLVVSLTVSILLFGDRPGLLQVAGIALALLALVLLSPGKSGDSGRLSAGGFGLLVLTLLFGGGADAMAKVFAQLGGAGEDRLYFFWLFLTATVLCVGLLVLEGRRTGKRILPGELAAGILVGVPNYYSSYLLLRAIQTRPAALVYPTYSAGTIVLVLALSALLFRERLTHRQLPGLGIILLALVLLNL